MAAEDFNSAKGRLEQAKEEAIWIIAVSNDPASHTQEYNLSPEEREVLVQESQKHLVEIQDAIERLRQTKGVPPSPSRGQKKVEGLPDGRKKRPTRGQKKVEGLPDGRKKRPIGPGSSGQSTGRRK